MKFKSFKDEAKSGNIEMFGNKKIIIEDCKGVLDYTENFIKLDLGKISLKISGDNLVIESYIYEQISLIGEIISIEFMN